MDGLNRQKMFYFGIITRLSSILVTLFLLFFAIDNMIREKIALTSILILVFIIIFSGTQPYWIFSRGILIDKKTNKILISSPKYFMRKNNIVRYMNVVECIDIETNELGFNIIIKYIGGHIEKIFFNFFIISLSKKAQYNRLQKEIAVINKCIKQNSEKNKGLLQ